MAEATTLIYLLPFCIYHANPESYDYHHFYWNHQQQIYSFPQSRFLDGLISMICTYHFCFMSYGFFFFLPHPAIYPQPTQVTSDGEILCALAPIKWLRGQTLHSVQPYIYFATFKLCDYLSYFPTLCLNFFNLESCQDFTCIWKD